MTENTKNVNTILIIGGGFAGVRCALDIAKNNKKTRIVLVSKEKDFIYYPAMYRFVAGAPRAHVAISLEEIFKQHHNVEVVIDEIQIIDATQKTAQGVSGKNYTGDYMVCATGSENNYFRIEGVNEISFNFKSFIAAQSLRDRISQLFESHINSDTQEMLVALHFVIVGGGPSGVELAGELVEHAHKLAMAHELPKSLVTIDLVERNERLLARMPKNVSDRVERRLRTLGVNVLLNRSMMKSESWTQYLGDMTLGAKTVIWTAGVRPSSISQNIVGCEYTERGKVVVTDNFETQDGSKVFFAGDIVDTSDAGLAQSAVRHARHIAGYIMSDIDNQSFHSYVPKEFWHVVPVGPGWGALMRNNFTMFGKLAYWARFAADIRFLLSIISIKKVWNIFSQTRTQIIPHHTESSVQ